MYMAPGAYVFLVSTGWRRLIGCLKLQVICRHRATNYRALLRKMTYEDKAPYASTPPCRLYIRANPDIYMKTYINIYTYMYVYLNIYICVYIHDARGLPGSHQAACHSSPGYIHIYIYIYMYMYIFVFIYVCMYMPPEAYVVFVSRLHIVPIPGICINTYIHIYLYLYIYTYLYMFTCVYICMAPEAYVALIGSLLIEVAPGVYMNIYTCIYVYVYI